MRRYLVASLFSLSTLSSAVALAETDPLVDFSVRFNPWADSEVNAFGAGADGDGRGLGTRLEVGGALFVFGDYNLTDIDTDVGDIDFTETRFGAGFKHSTERGYISVSGENYRLKLEHDGTSGSAKDDGIGVHLGGGFNLGSWATLYGKLGIISLDDYDGQEYLGGITGNISDNGRIFVEYRNLALEDGPVDFDHSDARVGVAFSF